MKTYEYHEYTDSDSDDGLREITEDDIIKDYFEHWFDRMVKSYSNNENSNARCVLVEALR